MESVEAEASAAPAVEAAPSRWEWLPVLTLPILVLVYCLTAPGSYANRFVFFVGPGLLPGVVWRLVGYKSWNVHRACFAIALVAFVLDNPNLRPDRTMLDKMAANWHLIALGFAISFTQSLWGMLRTHRLLSDSGVDISSWETLKLTLIGAFFNIFLPGSTGGDAYRVYAVSRGYSTRLGAAIASITLDRLLGLPSLILVVALGVLMDYRFFLSNRILAGLMPFITGAGAICLVLVIYLVFAGKAHRRSVRRGDVDRPAGDERRGWLARTHGMIATNVKRPATLPLALLYGFLSHVACIACCQCFGVALGVAGVPGLRYYLIVPMAMTINAIPFAPGGVGQGELAMAKLLDMASPGLGNLQVGVMIMLLFRISNMAVGLLGGYFYARGEKRPASPGSPREWLEKGLPERPDGAGTGGGGDGEWR